MKKLFILFLLLSLTGCDKLFKSVMPEKPQILLLEEKYFKITPEKTVYTIGDTIDITITFPKILKTTYGEEKELKPYENFRAELSPPRQTSPYKDSLDLFINSEKVNFDLGVKKLSIIEKNNMFSVNENIKIVFKKDGEYKFHNFLGKLFYVDVNYHQEVYLEKNVGLPSNTQHIKTVTFKVEP